MLARLALIIATLITFAPSQSLARGSVSFEPTSKWSLDRNQESCTLMREFAAENNVAYLVLRRFGPGARLQVVVYSDVSDGSNKQFEFRFGSDAEWRETAGVFLKMEDDVAGVILDTSIATEEQREAVLGPPVEGAKPTHTQLELVELHAIGSADTVELKRAFDKDIVLRSGPLSAALKGLQDCSDKLLADWGFDPAQQALLTRLAEPEKPDRIYEHFPYPKTSRWSVGSTLLNIRMNIGADGTVEECHITLRPEHAGYEEKACKKLQREVKFNPALDANGSPVASYWITQTMFTTMITNQML